MKVLRGDVNRLEKGLKGLVTAAKFKKANDHLHERFSKFRADMNQLRADVNQLRADVNQLRADLNQLRDDVSNLRGEVRTLRILMCLILAILSYLVLASFR